MNKQERGLTFFQGKSHDSGGGNFRGSKWRGRGQGGRGGNRSGQDGNAGNKWNGSKNFWRGKRGFWRGRWRGNKRDQGQERTVPHTHSQLSTSQTTIETSADIIRPSSSQAITTMFDSKKCPFKEWRIYLPTEEYSQESGILNKLDAAMAYLEKSKSSFHTTKHSFKLDMKALKEDSDFQSSWPSLSEDITNNMSMVSGIFGLAMHTIEKKKSGKDGVGSQSGIFIPVNTFAKARPVNVEPITPIHDLKAKDFGKFVSLKGTVIRTSNERPQCAWFAFRCTSCDEVQSVYQPWGRYVEPLRCSSTSCQGRRFAPERLHPLTITVGWQKIKIQECVQYESGQIPATIECELTEDLCDSAVPGDLVVINGIVKNINLEAIRSADRKTGSFTHLYIQALALINAKKRTRRADTNEGTSMVRDINFTYGDYSDVQEIQAMGSQIFKFLVHSICPSIFGHELVKAGLILGLFGGSRSSEEFQQSTRPDPHVLVVGDPGLGKSQMLTACASVAPRGVFVTGNTSTTSGLTVTLSRESSNEFSIEAGALVLADQGVCCIDEFDKMSSQHNALLEAMEQQTVSVAKSGVLCNMPARTAVLAAANPVSGHYNNAKTVSENLKMNPALLSRFDLVFILIDRPDESLDGMLSEHIMRLHSSKSSRSDDTQGLSTSTTSIALNSSLCDTLKERLKRLPNESINPLPLKIFRKYIAYAKQYVKVQLNQDACQMLQDFYVELRQKYHRIGDGTPLTTRQIESMKRLTEARAKLELREEATAEDAKDVIEIMKASMIDTCVDANGCLDFSRASNGSGMSTRGAAKKFINALTRQYDITGKNEYSVQEMKSLMKQMSISVPNFFDFLQSLNVQGFLIKKSSSLYKLVTVM